MHKPHINTPTKMQTPDATVMAQTRSPGHIARVHSALHAAARSGRLLVALSLAFSTACNAGEEQHTTQGDSETGTSTSTSTSTSTGTTSEANTNDVGETSTSTSTTSDGTTSDDTGSSSTTGPQLCGNGELNAGEECDDGNTDNTDSCPSTCTFAHCGDGFVEDGAEDCDDSNHTNFDGCSSECKQELIVFLSSHSFSGNLTPTDSANVGLARADDNCQDLADAGGLPGQYMAWLSDDSKAPATRFGLVDFTGDFVNLDDGRIARGWSDLTDGSLIVPLNLDEYGIEYPDAPVWTNTQSNGEEQNNNYHCNNWSSQQDDQNGSFGNSSSIGSNWTTSGGKNCNASAHLYCFQVSIDE